MRIFLRSSLLALQLSASVLLATPNDDAAALIEKGQFLAAERIVEPLATVKKPDARSLYQLSQVRLGQQQTEEAIKLVERAIKLDPTRPEYFSHLGQACGQRLTEAAGVFLLEKVRKSMEQSLKLDPNHVPGLLGLARYYSMAPAASGGSFKRAKEYADRVAQIDPFQGELELGRLNLLVREPAAALAHYEKAIQLKPDNGMAHYSAAVALMQLGRLDEARVRIQTCLKFSPTFKDAKDALESLNAPPPAKPAA